MSKSGKTRQRRPYKVAAHAAFREGLKEGHTLTALCKRLHINRSTATEWLKGLRMQIAEALDAYGLDEHLIAARLHRLLDSKKPNRVHLDTIGMIARLRDYYPAEKKEPPFQPVTVVIRDVIPATGGEVVAARARSNFHNTGREILQASDAPESNSVEAEIEAGNPDWE